MNLDGQIGRHQNRTKTVASHADINTRVGQLGGNNSQRIVWHDGESVVRLKKLPLLSPDHLRHRFSLGHAVQDYDMSTINGQTLRLNLKGRRNSYSQNGETFGRAGVIRRNTLIFTRIFIARVVDGQRAIFQQLDAFVDVDLSVVLHPDDLRRWISSVDWTMEKNSFGEGDRLIAGFY